MSCVFSIKFSNQLSLELLLKIFQCFSNIQGYMCVYEFSPREVKFSAPHICGITRAGHPHVKLTCQTHLHPRLTYLSDSTTHQTHINARHAYSSDTPIRQSELHVTSRTQTQNATSRPPVK